MQINAIDGAGDAAIAQPVKMRLILLAKKYEVPAFTKDDPSRVLKRYSSNADTEAAAFIAAMLSFGRREQFLQKIDLVLAEADAAGGPALWLCRGEYSSMFAATGEAGAKKFYRFYSFADVASLFDALRAMLILEGSLGAFFEALYNRRKLEAEKSGRPAPHLADVVSAAFPACPLVPSGKNGANKRVNMFLRWMVRQGSPVDAGLWRWFSPAELIVPIDTHVLQEAVRLKLIPAESRASKKTALLLTRIFRQIWPDDPCRGDFALFGLGVDSGRAESRDSSLV